TNFNATVNYTVQANAPVASFKIAVYVSADATPFIKASDKLLTTLTVTDAQRSPGVKAVGLANLKVPSFIGADAISADFVLKARIDARGDARDVFDSGDTGVVSESNEQNNVAVGANVSDTGLDSDNDGLTDKEEVSG